MQATKELKLKFEANLSVALNEVSELSESTFQERLPVATFCLRTAKESGEELASQLMASIEELESLNTKHQLENKVLNEQLIELKSLQKEVNALTEKLADAESKLATAESESKDAKVQANALSKELASLRALPTQLSKLQKELDTATKRVEREKGKVKTLNDQLKAQKTKFDKLKAETPKSKEPEEVEAAGKIGRFYVAVVEHPLAFKIDDRERIKRIDDLKWHVRILSSSGIAVFPSISEWLAPILPFCTEFAEDWTSEVQDTVLSVIEKRAEKCHPQLVERVKKAKAIKITKKDFSEEEVRWLKAANMKNLYSALSMSFSAFLNNLRKGSPDSVIGDAEALDLHKRLSAMAPAI